MVNVWFEVVTAVVTSAKVLVMPTDTVPAVAILVLGTVALK